jgi:hypothetical protein
MCWKTIEIKNRDRLAKRLLSYDSGWMFRGHSRASWELQPTLERTLLPVGWTAELVQKCEEYTLHDFRSRAHHYISRDSLPKTTLGWLALMQHHGVPTRLLDFTLAPFIALFFAFDGVTPDADEPCAIWAIDFRRLMKASVEYLNTHVEGCNLNYLKVATISDKVLEQYLAEHSHNALWVTEPSVTNLRLERQKGTFLLSGSVEKRILDLLPEQLPQESVHKLVLPASLSTVVFTMLKSMGIENSRLFADLAGLAKDIRSELIHQVTRRAAP